MLATVRDINAKFGDGKTHVTLLDVSSRLNPAADRQANRQLGWQLLWIESTNQLSICVAPTVGLASYPSHKFPQTHLSFPIGARSWQGPYYHVAMLRYHVAFYLPKASGDMVVSDEESTRQLNRGMS
jgi:hypothetical protein